MIAAINLESFYDITVHWGIHSIFFGRQGPTAVFLAPSDENINEIVLLGNKK